VNTDNLYSVGNALSDWQVEQVLTVAVSPLLPPGSVVTSLRAVDADADQNAHVTYRLHHPPDCDLTDAGTGYDVISGGGNNTSSSGDVISAAVPAGRRQCGLFRVDADQGGLFLEDGGQGLATFDDGTVLNVSVSARDAGVPPLTGTVLVRVVVNSTVPLPSVPTQRHHQDAVERNRWLALLIDEGVVIVCSLAVFVVLACCLSVVVVVLAGRRARARQRRDKHGYNCRAEEEKALGAATSDDMRSVPQSVVVYGSCEAPRTVPTGSWQDVGSPRAKRNGWTSLQMT